MIPPAASAGSPPAGGRGRRRRHRANRYRLALTPAGAGVLTLCFPGLLVSAASGQRPLMALSLGAALVLAANAVWALVALQSFTVAVQAPVAVTVGNAVPLTVSVDGPHRLEGALGVRGGVRRWVPAQMPGEGVVLWRPRSRGVVDLVTVRLQSSIPLGLAAVVREVAVAPPAPVHAAPPAEAVALASVPMAGGRGADGGPLPASGSHGSPVDGLFLSGAAAGPGDPTGLRPYVPGDPGRDIHWPTVARTGTLMVRERPPAVGLPPEVTVVVRADDDDGIDRVAGQARGAAEHLLQAGYTVRVDSVEAGGARVVAAVHGRDDLIVRLARLGPGEPAERGAAAAGPAGDGWRPVRLMVDQDGLRWRSPA